MSFWNWSKTPRRKPLRQQIAEYGLEDKPFTNGLLLSALAQIEATESEGECRWKDLDDAVLSSMVIVTSHLTSTAMRANGLLLFLTRGVVIRQAKIHAILTFSTYLQICLISSLTQEGATIDRLRVTTLTLRALFLALSEDEWNIALQDLSKMLSETVKELARENHPQLGHWKETMGTFVTSYILSFSNKSPQLQAVNYPWVFEQHLALLLKTVEGCD